MKFTNGYWHTRPGINPHYPAQVTVVCDAQCSSLTTGGLTVRVQMMFNTINPP